nr:CIA30 family protein [Roseibacterium persicicum]
MPAMTPAADLEWSYLADTVMGGVSQGAARIEGGVLRLTGTVSTANRGGFIQARTALPAGLPEGTTALRLRVRGNGERYFVHLRTTRTRLPWQYYQQGFPTAADWAEVDLPLAGFTASGSLMAGAIRAEEVRSLGVVAYGRDHEADVSVAALGAV